MFEGLSQALQGVFHNLRGYGRLSERNIREALREVRTALLEADVNYAVARDFIRRVQDESLGETVLNSVTPGQQIIQRMHRHLTELLGGASCDFNLEGPPPAGIVLLGLQGSGKTTTAAKLAHAWKGEGRRVLLAACDLRRPAAIEQLKQLADQIGVDRVEPQPGDTVLQAAQRALERAQREHYDQVVYDTGGRLQCDTELVEELRMLHAAVAPRNTVLVLDAAIGREAVAVAQAFHSAVGLTGLILTKLDGDARGGAALSVHAVTGCPILRIGVGENPEDLEPFHPNRMASRILGMGDVVSLVEKAQAAFETDQAHDLEQKYRRNTFTLEDFLLQLRGLDKMGPLDNLINLIPGANRMPARLRKGLPAGSGNRLKHTEAIILSMTPQERRHPERIDGRRRLRIARGSGTRVSDVNELLKSFRESRRLIKQLKQAGKRLPPMRPLG